MHSTLRKLNIVKDKVNDIIKEKQLKTNPKIIVVTKTFSFNSIIPLLESGHIHFGENKVQETETKWSNAKNKYKNVQLHMIGKLQSNKAKKAIQIFDYIHSLDNKRLALKLSVYQKELNKYRKYFIQINLADESQKSGIKLSELDDFYNYCVKKLSLNVIGLMCLPPISNTQDYFRLLKEPAQKLNLTELSFGMSNDFENAVLHESTFLRLGTLIMGKRTPI